METSTNEMRELIFLGFLASVDCLGDTFPFGNTQNNIYTPAAQAAGSWTQHTCAAGTKQSPINVVSQYAISKSQPDFTLKGYEQDLTVDWQIDGTPTLTGYPFTTYPFTSVNFRPRQSPADIPGKLSGGPLPNGER